MRAKQVRSGTSELKGPLGAFGSEMERAPDQRCRQQSIRRTRSIRRHGLWLRWLLQTKGQLRAWR